MMSAPASTKARANSAMCSGWSLFHSSGASPDCRPRANRLLPVAPSASSQGRSASRGVNRSVIAEVYLVAHTFGRPRSAEGMVSHDGLTAIGPGGNDIYRCPQKPLEPFEIAPCILRQILILRDPDARVLPAG